MAVTASSSKLTVEDTGAKILERLRAALRSDGDFPVRARVVTQLRSLANSPNTKIDQISDLILREPSLGTRVLHLVNSAYYQRTVPILTVKQGVMQIGMRSLSDLCAGFVLMQKFVPAAQRGGVFADSVKRTIVTALVSNRLAADCKSEGVSERGYLAGTFFNLGYLLLAYYFPQVFEAASKRAATRNTSTTKSISEILGISSWELSVAIVDALKIPDFYREVLLESHKPREKRNGDRAVLELAEVLAEAGRLSDSIVEARRKEDVEAAIDEIVSRGRFSKEKLVEAVDQLGITFEQHCALIELGFLALPPFIKEFSKIAFRTPEPGEVTREESQLVFARYTADIRAAIESESPLSSVLMLAMEAITLGLNFERAVLLYSDSDETRLMGRLSAGKEPPIDVPSLDIPIYDDSDSAPVKAFLSGRVQLFGDGLFADGWPFAAIPIGNEERPKGVLYVDSVSTDKSLPIDDVTRASLILIAELLDQSVASWE